MRHAHLRQHNVRSQQRVKHAFKFTRRQCPVRKSVRKQVVLVSHVRPRDLADARTTQVFEQGGKQYLLVRRECVQERGHVRVLQVPDDVLHVVDQVDATKR